MLKLVASCNRPCPIVRIVVRAQASGEEVPGSNSNSGLDVCMMK